MSGIKKIIVLALCFFITVTTRSQILISILFGDKLNTDKMTFGLSIGNAWNNLKGYNQSDPQSNFNLGLFLTLKLETKLFLQFDALAKYKLGAKGLPVYTLGDATLDTIYQHGSLRRSLSYLGLNTSIQYRFWKYLNVDAGPQIAIRVKAKDFLEADHEQGKQIFEKNMKDSTTRFDFGLASGISWQFSKGRGLKLAVRYYWSLVDLYPSEAGNNEARSFQLNLYIPIGGKKQTTTSNDSNSK
ncbi:MULTISPECIES: outer membrane beta-barrel protein [Niastella]|uniref:Outer membrane beta-barrel protein n=1 Tax=Niastella soli TaxID=2821487 RepID=A0ABS3YV10_9BACT|nr:outer membrane beta-barrel protein [Niastella soli]MBO9201708.1 outer membrane beta-barrel protein [Niastella soli]